MAERALPRHIGIIMDGNGRWAALKHLPRTAGHKIGARVFRKITEYCAQIGLEYLTVYAFSTENWKRPQEEVKAIIQLLVDYLEDESVWKGKNVSLHFIGDLSAFDEEVQALIHRTEEICKDYTGTWVNIAINYGGQDEILRATKKLAKDCAEGLQDPEEITPSVFERYLDTAGQPPVDLVIRPSGEHRLSNFLIWQCAYAEFVYMDVLWPDFSEKNVDAALAEYAKRSRRFGGLTGKEKGASSQ